MVINMDEVEEIREQNIKKENSPVVKTGETDAVNSYIEDEVINEDMGGSDGRSNASERSESVQDEELEDRDSGTEMSGEDENLDDENTATQEREEGDGQESLPSKKVDDDEDKRNPQYIPKRGTFYEHDDRTAVDEETEEGKEGEETDKKEAEETTPAKKKVWNEKEGSRWSHDKYNDDEQAPKSRSELVSIYGYDIRNEDGPPRARRRRRYGRGPNKYTRNWEDEDAYNKGLGLGPPKPRTQRKPRSRGEEFPPLHTESVSSKSPDRWPQNSSSMKQDQASPPSINRNVPNRDSQTQNGNVVEDREKAWPSVEKKDPYIKKEPYKQVPKSNQGPLNKRDTFYQDNSNSTRIVKSHNFIPEDSYRGRGITRARGYRGGGRPNTDRRQTQPQETEQDYIMSQNFINKNVTQQNITNTQTLPEDIERGVANMNLNPGISQSRTGRSNIPPRLQGQESQRQVAPKRYSSLRQRSLPETGVGAPGVAPQQQGPPAPAPTFNPHHAPPPPTIIHYTPHAEYPQQGAAPPMVSNGTQPMMGAPGYPVPQYAQAPYAGTYIGPQPVPQPPPPGPPPPQIINFGPQPPPGPPVQPPAPQFPPADFAAYPHQQFAPVNQTQAADVFHHQAQSQGGITYYSMQSQQVMQLQRMQATQKRPKAAIPIVPPPELKPRGRGRLQTNDEQTAVGGENTAYEGEGNFNNDVSVQQ